MKKTILMISTLLGLLWGALPPASAVTIYTEDWGNASTAVRGDGNINLVGWTGVCRSQTAKPYLGIYGATGASDPANGLGLPPNTVYFTGLTGTAQTGAGMFYTTDTAGAGSGGDSAFVDIDPTLYTNLTINIEEGGGPYLTNYFAVRVGGSWYVATSYPLPADLLTLPMFTNASLVYTNPANVWNTLTLGTTNVTIGSVASPDLTAKITGIGIVEINNPASSAFDGLNYNQLVINQGSIPPTPAHITATAVTPQYAYVGGGASFLIGAAGTPILHYNWQTNGFNVNGARYVGAGTAMLTITNINANDALPSYSVIVTNLVLGGRDTNSGLSLIVSPVPDGVLYAETFPYVGLSGNLPITGVGWSSAAAGGAFGIYQPGPGLGDVFSYSATATTNAYFTTDLLDTGLSGLPFVDINPASYPAITFQCNFTPGNGPGQVPGAVTVYWAVQMNGTWYSSAKPIGISLAAQNNYLMSQLAYNPAATNWNNLTIDTVNNLTIIGSQASTPLWPEISPAPAWFLFMTHQVATSISRILRLSQML